MDRRTYLTAAGVVFAGCSSSPTETETPTSSDSPTETATPTQTPTDTPTDTPTASPTAEPTPTETPEPTQAEIQLQRAIEDLDKALDQFAPLDRPMIEVTAMSAPFSQRDVRDALDGARGHLGAAKDKMTDDTPDEVRKLHRQLTGVFWFFWWAAPVQVAIKSAASDLLTIESAAYAGNGLKLNQSKEIFLDDIDEVEANLDKLRRDSDPEDANAPCELTEEEYHEKLNQFESEADDMEELVTFFDEFLPVVSTVADAIEDYEDESYGKASSGFYSAGSSFEDRAESLSPDDYRDEFSEIVDRAVCVSEAMAAGCRELDVAATAGMNGNESKQETARENAKEEFEQCDLVFEHMGFLREFYPERNSSIAGFFHSVSLLLTG